MDIGGEYLFDAPQQYVWDALRDPKVLTTVMPGGEGFEETGSNEYVGILNIKVGPVRGKFKGEIKLQDIQEPDSYTMVVDGKGAPGFVKATGNVKLEARDRQTLLQYSGKAQVGGKIASVGQRLMDTSARSIIRQSLEGLNDYLQKKLAYDSEQSAAAAPPQAASEAEAKAPPETEAKAPATEDAAAPASAQRGAADAKDAAEKAPEAKPADFQYTPPSQAELARRVAQDVAAEMIPKPVRITLLIGFGAVLGALACWLLR
ncbi:MAG: carbon monoxide dehydrogenase subunit G [Myxococcales bacterium]|nr:carbon monoxide dehydrogenase subunit G [Myxococcales bacterium]